jgi:DNA modification methylase
MHRTTATLPYYSGVMATLYLGDCRTVVPTLPRQSVDLLIADPPYGVGWQSGRRTEQFDRMAGDDATANWPNLLGELTKHVLREFRHVYVFGYGAEQLAGPLMLGGRCELVWDKDQPGLGDLSLPWGPEHERLAFGVYVTRPSGRARGDGRLAARLRQGSVLRAARPNAAAIRHPDEKPVPLLRALVESSSCLGETVLDPTCGVGSTLVAAVLAGRKAIGIEIDQQYLDIAVDRVREAERVAKLAEVC